MVRYGFVLCAFIIAGSFDASAQLRLASVPDSLPRKISLTVLPQNFYKQGLGFFCRQELKLQKLTSLPVFIRLGSKDYVDYLEKKPNSSKPLQ